MAKHSKRPLRVNHDDAKEAGTRKRKDVKISGLKNLTPGQLKDSGKVHPARVSGGGQSGYVGLQQWEREFLRDAKADGLAVFRDHLRALGLKGETESLLKGTLLVMKACWSYSLVDGYSFAPFLAMQRYNPASASAARYAFTFDLCRKGRNFARVFVGDDWAWRPKAPGLDLADLYERPCFSDLWITRTDGEALTLKEIKRLEQEVTQDFRFDYPEDELDIWFDDSCNFDLDEGSTGALRVSVNDHEEEDSDDLAVANTVESTAGKKGIEIPKIKRRGARRLAKRASRFPASAD